MSMKLTLSNDLTKTIVITKEVTELSSRTRFTYALKKFFIFFTLAVFSVFIPVMHFFLVPLFLILSIYMFKKTYALRWTLNLSEIRCCQCGGAMGVGYDISENNHLSCKLCFAKYLVESRP